MRPTIVRLQRNLAPSLPGALRPLPKTTRNLNGQTIAQLASEHDNLPAMVTFMRNEIGKDMPHVEGKVAPGVRRGGWDRAPSVTTERQQTDNAAATVAQCWNQLLRFNLVSIDGSRHSDAVFLSQRLDPHTPRIVDVAGDHPNGSTWSPRHCGSP